MESPKWWATWLKNRMIQGLSIPTAEAEREVSEYPSFGAFFSRRLKEGARVFEKGHFCSPCDGRLQSFEVIESDSLVQAKGIHYSLGDLLSEQDGLERYRGGVAVTIYLAPHNYHRVHFPDDLELLKSQKVKGDLWPVNHASVNGIHPLFCLNERWIVQGENRHGKMALIMVGATNVGKMELLHLDAGQFVDDDLLYAHEPSLLKQAGEEMGVFHMGSTVILLLDRSLVDHYKMELSVRDLMCGERLG